MSETTLLLLIHEPQVFADMAYLFLIRPELRFDFSEVFIGKRSLEKLAVLPAFLFAAYDYAHFLYSAVDQFLKENENHRLDHAVFVDNREEVFLQKTCCRIKARAKTCYGNDRLADCITRRNREFERPHTERFQIFNQFFLTLGILCKELN